MVLPPGFEPPFEKDALGSTNEYDHPLLPGWKVWIGAHV